MRVEKAKAEQLEPGKVVQAPLSPGKSKQVVEQSEERQPKQGETEQSEVAEE